MVLNSSVLCEKDCKEIYKGLLCSTIFQGGKHLEFLTTKNKTLEKSQTIIILHVAIPVMSVF